MNDPSASPARRLSRWLTPVEIAVLGAIWGASFLFMRVAAADLGAFALVEIRLALGALILLPFTWRARAHLTVAGWWRLAAIGAINSALPFALFAWAAQRAPAGIGAITNSMTVVFTALVALVLYRERISALRALGLCAGFAGVAVLASGKVGGESVGPAVLAGTLAALLYAFGANLIRRSLVGIPASAVAGATLLCASVLMLPLAIATWPRHSIGACLLAQCDPARRGVHRRGLRSVLPPDSSHRRAARVNRYLPDTAVWRDLGLAVARGNLDGEHGGGCGSDPGRRRPQSAAHALTI